MYEQYFAFTRSPFTVAPNPRFLYPSPQYRDGLERLWHGLKKEGGFVVLTGEVGTGKTTLCRLFLKKLPPNVHHAVVLNAKLNSDDLLSSICKELGAPCDAQNASTFQKTEAISTLLHQNHKAAKRTLLILEEAQNLSPDALETLRLLTNIETNTTKLIHILLIGQPELVATLNRPDMRQLAQRIIARFHLQPLSEEETYSYITHRLSVAGGQNTIFKKSAMSALYDASGGIPRLVNLIADRSLQSVYKQNIKHANRHHVEAAAAVINGNAYKSGKVPRMLKLPPQPYLWAVALITLGLFTGSYWLWRSHHNAIPEAEPAQIETASQPEQPAPIPAAPPPASESLSKPAFIAEPSSQTMANAVANIASADSAIDSTPFNASTTLLGLWHISGSPEEPLCDIALQHRLQCISAEQQTLVDLLSYNRPALVTIFGNNGRAQTAVLQAINNQQTVQLNGADGDYELSVAEFELRWRGDLQLLWQPPPGYIDSLYVGDKSFQTVYWLQESLNTLGLVDGKIITGGIYTQLLSNHVQTLQRQAQLTADGILGKKTIMAINTRLGAVPTLKPLQTP